LYELLYVVMAGLDSATVVRSNDDKISFLTGFLLRTPCLSVNGTLLTVDGGLILNNEKLSLTKTSVLDSGCSLSVASLLWRKGSCSCGGSALSVFL
jgi:hypothetical protein